MPKLLDLIIPGRDDPRTDFRIRSQLPFLAWTAALLLAVFVILLPLGFLSNGADGFFWALLPLIAAQAAAVGLLRAGRYRAAAYLTTVSIIGASFAALYLMAYRGNNSAEIYRGFGFAAVMMAINVVVALSPRQIWLFLGLYLPGWLASFFTIFSHYGADGHLVPIAIVGVLASLCETAALVLIRNLSESMLATAEEQTRLSGESLSHITRLIMDAEEGVSIGEQVLSATGTAQAAAARVADIQEYLSGESVRLLEDTEGLIASGESVMGGARSMEASLAAQGAAIARTSAALTEISQNVESVSGVARRRRGMLDGAARASDAHAALLGKLDGAFRSVQESSEGIGRFVATVQDIASRTSLLSMNASIEAARAGAAGRGFKIVSQEIRTLAGETQMYADRIKEMIEKNDATVKQTGAFIDEFGGILGRNREDTRTLVAAMDEILRGVAEMETGTREVTAAMQRMVAETRSSGGMVEAVVSGIGAQQAALSHFSSFARELDERIVRLKESVADIRASTDRVSEAGRLNIEHTKKLQL